MKIISWLYKQSLSQQLLVSCGLSLATVGLGTLWFNAQLIRSDLEKQVRTRALSITQSIEFATEGLLELQQRHILRRVVQNYGTLPTVVEIAIVNPDGVILADSNGNSQGLYKDKYPELLGIMTQAQNTGISSSQKIVSHRKSVLVQILPFNSSLFGTSRQRGLAIAFLDLKQIKEESEQTFLTSTLTLLLGIVVILLFIGFLIRRNVLVPLDKLNIAVTDSKNTGNFTIPDKIPVNEIHFLARTFESVFAQLASYEQLKNEITQREKAEEILRESEARERNKSEELAKILEELQQTQTQLIQSEKMSSLGQLVAGVAHEINNPVNFIHGNIEPLREYIQDLLDIIYLYEKLCETHPVIQDEIENIYKKVDLKYIEEDVPKILNSLKIGTQRIRQIVLSLRIFSRIDEADFKAVDIHEGIDSTLMILQHRLKEEKERPEITIIKNYGNLPSLECYAGQLNQVFMNILSNAIDALEERVNQENSNIKPQINITTSVLDEKWIKIAIADNGSGIAENIKKQIFNPFFTTKAVGKGTGMGMSISYQIITEKHKGTLEFSSVINQGTEFIITIPQDPRII